MPNQAEWIKVVTDPMGIAAFALFLLFLILSQTKKADERRWLAPVFVVLAIISLLGGFKIALLTMQTDSKTVEPSARTFPGVTVKGDINVESHSDQSPAIGINFGTLNSGTLSSEQKSERPNDKTSDVQK